MKIVTRKVRAADIFKRWEQQYPSDLEGIGKKLKELGDNPDPDEVDRIIGNTTWTHLICDHCKNYVEVAVGLWEEFYLCKECLEKAVVMILQEEEPQCDKHKDLLPSESSPISHDDKVSPFYGPLISQCFWNSINMWKYQHSKEFMESIEKLSHAEIINLILGKPIDCVATKRIEESLEKEKNND